MGIMPMLFLRATQASVNKVRDAVEGRVLRVSK
jgi:hypothetical protein